MTSEEWARYVEQLRGELQELAQNIMRRVSRLLNKDRSLLLTDMQRVERRADENLKRWHTLEQDTGRISGHIERLEERVRLLEERTLALATQLARVQQSDDEAVQGGT